MAKDGKKLEALVAFIEAIQLPSGFEVKTNSTIFDEDGTQLAEFDVLISGNVGTTRISWLIECRDRPSSGAAPASWIEQLAGRRDRFLLNKITAVSTSGFSTAARKYAQEAGIELREVNSLEISELEDLFAPLAINVINNLAEITNVELRLDHKQKGVKRINPAGEMAGIDVQSNVLWHKKDKRFVSVNDAFLGAVQHQNMFADMIIGGPPKQVQFRAKYMKRDSFYLQTSGGKARVAEIDFQGVLKRTYQIAPALQALAYNRSDSSVPISRTIEYETQPIGGKSLNVQVHSIDETGEIHITASEIPEH